VQMSQSLATESISTKEFKIDELTRHFTTANSQAKVATSGSSERNKAPKFGTIGGQMTVRDKALKAQQDRKVTDSSKGARVAKEVDAQLNLFEFINLLVRIAFWRANPQWGSKYNKKDLTPVPESTQILLEECILPNARRDTSGEFKKVLQADAATQGVLTEYRDRLQAWLRPILRKERSHACRRSRYSVSTPCVAASAPRWWASGTSRRSRRSRATSGPPRRTR